MKIINNKRVNFIVFASIGLVLIAGLTLVTSHPLRRAVRINFETALAHAYRPPSENYPDNQTANLTDTQKKIIEITKQEYAKKPVSFDGNVQKYSQGAKEAWCANFASWVMLQAGVPFSNPNNPSNWRIPGVYTLHEYFLSQRTYHEANTYTPKVGDTALYLDGRGHTNIVISVKSDTMTTVGGNETGHLRINTQKFNKGTEGLSGFGELKLDSR